MIISPPIITIDGPSGSGKGTLSKVLSKKLKWNILDSGAIYRILAMEALAHKIDIGINCQALMNIASKLDVTFINRYEELSVLFEGKIVNDKIYNEKIGDLASKVALFPEIRKVLLKYHRGFYKFPGLIANGRDMGTVVFPNATLKIFLDASSKVRCARRLYQLKEQGIHVNFCGLLKTIQTRDNRDYTRRVAPLIPAGDALIFNSNYLSLSEIVYGVLKCFYNSYCI